MGKLDRILAVIFLSINIILFFLPFTNKLLIIGETLIIISLAWKAIEKEVVKEKVLTSKQKRLMKKIEKNIPKMDSSSFIKVIYEKEHPKEKRSKKNQ